MSDPILLVETRDGKDLQVDWIDAILPVKGKLRLYPKDISGFRSAIEVVSREQERISCFYSGRDLGQIVDAVIEHHRDLAVRQLQRTKAFRDDMLAWFRAMAIVLDTVSRAATHREKDARLRGAVDVIEGAISALRKEAFEIRTGGGSYYPFEDVFRSDYPTRELMERIRDLEEQLKANAPEAEG